MSKWSKCKTEVSQATSNNWLQIYCSQLGDTSLGVNRSSSVQEEGKKKKKEEEKEELR